MNICLCGAQSGYQHSPNCPRPLFRATEAQEEAWLHDYEAIKAKQEATQRILDRRAAAGLLDSDAAAATMTEARQSIAASAEAMTQDFDAFMVAECEGRPDGIRDEYSSNTEGHW